MRNKLGQVTWEITIGYLAEILVHVIKKVAGFFGKRKRIETDESR
jgi:hypothetical protein